MTIEPGSVGMDDLLVAATDDDLEHALDRFIAVAHAHLGVPVGVVLHPSLGGMTYVSDDARGDLLEAASARNAASRTTVVPVDAPTSRLYGWFVIDARPLDDVAAVVAERLARVLAAALGRISATGLELTVDRRDPLTGLANRHALDAAIWTAARSRSLPWTVLIAEVADLDRVAAIGDDAIDDVLVALADRLRGLVRDGDLAARVDLDQFGVLLNGDEVEASRLAARVQSSLGGPVVTGHGTHELGVRLRQATANNADAVLQLVGAALAAPESITR